MRIAAFVVFTLVVAAGASSIEAHKSASRSGSLFVPRYAACSDTPREKVWCAGIGGAKKGLLADLVLGPLHAKRNNSRVSEPAHDAAVAAVYFNVREAVPSLRTILSLELPASARKSHLGMTIRSLRAEAAYALAHLGDKKSARRIEALVRDFETTGHGSLWIETLEALAVIDPAAAGRYAIDFLGRAKNFRRSMPGGTSKDRALDVILATSATSAKKAIPMLRQRTSKVGRKALTDAVFCRFMAARIKLGDKALRKTVRAAMVGSYSGTWMATCDNKLILAFGDEGADAAVLVRHLGRPDAGLDHGVTNGAYGRLLHMLSTSSFVPRKMVREAFEERARWPHVSDPSSRTYVAHFPLYNDAGLAALGDSKARQRVLALIADKKDDTGLAWLAAYWALRLELPGAQAPIDALMTRGGVGRDRNRSGIYRDVRLRVLEAYRAAFPKSSAWTAMLVNADHNVSERALYQLSRAKSAKACKPVVRAAYKTSGRLTDRAAEFGLLGLTTLGSRCTPHLESMAGDSKAPAVARGAALEIAAALGSKKIGKLADKLAADHPRHPAVARALRLAH